MDMHLFFRGGVALFLAAYLARHGLKRKSLSVSGAVAAFFVGAMSILASYRFGIILLALYFTGSKLTTLDEAKKSSLEEEFRKGGQRNATQVLANSILATILCIVFFVYIGEDGHIWFNTERLGSTKYLLRQQIAGVIWCMYVGHYACAAGDTWASEVGILTKPRPRLVTTLFLRQVPPGTNGGMSLVGTMASAAGGLFIGLVFYFLSYFCEYNSPPASQFPMVLVGFGSGIIGSLIDSILGATLQASYYSHRKKKIVKKYDPHDTSIEHICGADILSNEAVNAVSIAATMLLAGSIGPYIFCACDNLHC